MRRVADRATIARCRTSNVQEARGELGRLVGDVSLEIKRLDHPYEYDLVCIGAGAAGRHAALFAGEIGKRVAVIEKERTIARLGTQGGTLPSKTLREAVRSLKLVRRAEPYGVPSGGLRDRPDLRYLHDRVEEVCVDEGTRIADQFARLRIDLLSGKARFVDPHTLALESAHGVREITAEYILIAVGAKGIEPEGVACDGETIVDVDGLLELRELPRSLIVVGCGLAGLEFGTMFATLGTRVTLVDSREKPLDFLDRSLFDELVAELKRQRVEVAFGMGVDGASVECDERGKRAVVRFADGRTERADVALFATARNGVTRTLGLDRIGIEVSERGHVRVDTDYRTQVPNVFAAGDVIGHTPRASIAAEQGRVAAARMFQMPLPALSDREVFGVYSVPELAMIGSTEQQLSAAGVPYVAGVAHYREIARGAMLGDEFGYFKMLFDRRDRKLVGVHCAGTNATELIHVGQAVLMLNGTLDYFLTNVFNYPTLAECYKVAALDAANRMAAHA